jgi:hypothetical protein
MSFSHLDILANPIFPLFLVQIPSKEKSTIPHVILAALNIVENER